MKAEQLSVFLENKPGRLAAVTLALARENINISALSLADTLEFGVLRLITDRPEDARRVLARGGFMAQVTEVLAVEVPHQPGGLSRLLQAFKDVGLNVEYMYSLVARSDRGAIMILRLDDLDRALAAIAPDVGRAISGEELRNY